MNELETVLEESLEQIENGEASMDEILARHPELSEQLSPLLQAAAKLSVGRQVRPSPMFQARSRTELNIYMQEHPQLRRVSPMFWRVSIAFFTMMLALVASGTAFAQRALPGDRLYDWKLSSESVWRLVSRDQLGTDLRLSDRRVNELVAVSGDEIRKARAVENYEKLLMRFKSSENVQDQERILPILRSQHQSLINAGVSVPELENYFPR